jgi:hypothetical protein
LDAAVYGLIGTVIGGLITVLVTRLNVSKDLRVRELEIGQEAERARQAFKIEQQRSALEKYAGFLGAYNRVRGGIVDIITLLSDRPEGWSEVIGEIVESVDFSEAVQRVNDGAAWVSLICRDQTTSQLSVELDRLHDRLFSDLRTAKSNALEGREVDLVGVERRWGEVEVCFGKLRDGLRSDVPAL